MTAPENDGCVVVVWIVTIIGLIVFGILLGTGVI